MESVRKTKKSKTPKNICIACKKTIVAMGNKRQNGKDQMDWATRNLHKQCWKEKLETEFDLQHLQFEICNMIDDDPNNTKNIDAQLKLLKRQIENYCKLYQTKYFLRPSTKRALDKYTFENNH